MIGASLAGGEDGICCVVLPGGVGGTRATPAGVSHGCDSSTPCKRLVATKESGAGVASLTRSVAMTYANLIARQVAAASKL